MWAKQLHCWFHFWAKCESQRKRGVGDDALSAEILKVLITFWQESCSISEKYFLDKVAVLNEIDYYSDNIVSYFYDLYNKLWKWPLAMNKFVVKGQRRKACDASECYRKEQLLMKGTVKMMMLNSSQPLSNISHNLPTLLCHIRQPGLHQKVT